MFNAHEVYPGKVQIFSYSPEPFTDRLQAGRLLAEVLGSLRGKQVVVLGIPRGGLVVASSLAQGLDADLDIVISRKLGSPFQPELAMGALSESGEVFLNQNIVESLLISESFIEQEKQRQMAEIQRRSQLIRNVRPKIPLRGRIVVVTDDGVATGATIQAAVWALRQEKPQKLIAAIPVASEEAIDRLARDVDELFCLRMPADFMAVGQFYINFNQVTDDEVLEILKNAGSN
jgi:putative phosphoribosyl transferase